MPEPNLLKKLLHVGCGPARIHNTTKGFISGGWKEIRLDIDESVSPDIIGSMTDMAQVEDGSVDAIFSSHNIEHLYPHDVRVALKEFMRVLKDDGFCVITCPDLQSVCQLVAEDKLTDAAYESPAGPIAPIDILYGHRGFMSQGKLYMAHRCGFTEKVLRGTLISVGFQTIATIKRPSAFDLWAIATKKALNETEIELLARDHLPLG